MERLGPASRAVKTANRRARRLEQRSVGVIRIACVLPCRGEMSEWRTLVELFGVLTDGMGSE